MANIDKIRLGETTYNIQSDGVANPQDSSQSVIATQVINSVGISNRISTETIVDFPHGTRDTQDPTSVGWYKPSGSSLWINDVCVAGTDLSSSSKPIMVGIVYPTSGTNPDADRKAVQKAAGLLCKMESKDQTTESPTNLVAYATRLPEVTLSIAFRGINITSQ